MTNSSLAQDQLKLMRNFIQRLLQLPVALNPYHWFYDTFVRCTVFLHFLEESFCPVQNVRQELLVDTALNPDLGG